MSVPWIVFLVAKGYRFWTTTLTDVLSIFNSHKGDWFEWILLVRLIVKYSCHILFRLNTLKGTAKAPAVDLLRLNTPRSTKTACLTPKRHVMYDEQSRPFYMGVSPPSPEGNISTGCLESVYSRIILTTQLISKRYNMFYYISRLLRGL